MRLSPKFVFGTKAETLSNLKPFLRKSVIPEMLYFNQSDWINNPENIYINITSTIKEEFVIIRSSASCEDSELTALAGVHESILNVPTNDIDQLKEAIDQVFSSYESSSPESGGNEQVLVQSMVSNVSMSGVIFTQDMNTGAPYYIINYDDQSGRTDTITSGIGDNKTLIVLREHSEDLKSERFQALLNAVTEIELITGQSALDIEFAVSDENQVYLLQLRRITTKPNWNRGISIQVRDTVSRIKDFVNDRNRKIPGVFGSRSVYGQMPDWNPVEMIGTAPRPLAFSLYHKLITQSAWRVARKEMGYASPGGAPLMVSLGGVPFIDVRLSFHSYLPADLDSRVADKIVDCWLERLGNNRELHDKVEFDVAITTLDFDFNESLQRLMPDLLNKNEKSMFHLCLFNLTDKLITGKKASINGELAKIKILGQKRKSLLKGNFSESLLTVSALLEDCYTYGTIPFSILARHAFIARSLLLSLCRISVINQNDLQKFFNSIQTVAGKCVRALEKVVADEMTTEEFLDEFGHLRPGTYNILSPRYEQRPAMFHEMKNKSISQVYEKDQFKFPDNSKNRIEKAIKDVGFNIDADGLLNYARSAIAAREYAKFEFSKNISDAIEIIAFWGEKTGLSRDELSFIDIDSILDTLHLASGRYLEQSLREKSEIGARQHSITQALHLSHIIEYPEDVSIIPLLRARPNYVTKKKIRAEYIFISGVEHRPTDLNGKIVLIEGADPGFDWIFSYEIRGLVTRFGGANSHMAIRCAEFELPAAIGVGEQIFDRILRSKKVEINCMEGMVLPVEF